MHLLQGEVLFMVAQVVQATVPCSREEITPEISIFRKCVVLLPYGDEYFVNEVFGLVEVLDIFEGEGAKGLKKFPEQCFKCISIFRRQVGTVKSKGTKFRGDLSMMPDSLFDAGSEAVRLGKVVVHYFKMLLNILICKGWNKVRLDHATS